MLGDMRIFRSMRLRNILSFGAMGVDLDLGSLNVFIGPNASGKSNLIEALTILRATPTDITVPLREGGGISEWIWKGAADDWPAEIDAVVEPIGGEPLRYSVSLHVAGGFMHSLSELIALEREELHEEDRLLFRHRALAKDFKIRGWYERPGGSQRERKRNASQGHDPHYQIRTLAATKINPTQSVLSQRKDPDLYPDLALLGICFSEIRTYRDSNLGRFTPSRFPQRADLPADYLEENACNLGLVLNELEHKGVLRPLLLEKLRLFYENIQDVFVKIHGGTVQVYVREKGLREPIPATRLSDGTLRYLCLLTILCHPTPPPVVCIEEPELGMHPDIISTIAKLLIDASHRTQLFVTTHSDVLVDELTEAPEAVIVCEKEEGATTMRRLDKESLSAWLAKYTLGEIWASGELGGNRW